MNQIDPRILSQLAHFDGEVHQHRSAIASGRRREAQLEQERVESAAAVGAVRERLEALRASNKQLEAEIAELNRQAKLHHGRLNEIQDTREYRALNEEIKYLRRQVENKEEQVLANLELVEKAEAEETKTRAEYDQRMEAITREREKILAEREEKQARMEKAAADLEIYLGQIDPNAVRFYRRRAERQDRPVVWIQKGACSACHTRLTPQMQSEAISFSVLVTCQTCGRIVVGSLNQDSSVS